MGDRIARNSVKCGKCGDEIESRTVHDFRYCGCGAIAVDGGKEYLRRIGDIHGYIDTSVMCPATFKKFCQFPKCDCDRSSK